MDDLTVTTERAVGARWILKMLERLVEWSRMKFKARKSRSVVISKEKVQENYQFRIQGEDIPSLRDLPIKCLGKWYRSSLNDQKHSWRSSSTGSRTLTYQESSRCGCFTMV